LKRITVFGATGETGKQVVEQALAAGYEVVAYARNPSKLNVSHEHLTVIQGELSDVALIETALKGADAVLSALGPKGDQKTSHSHKECKTLLQPWRSKACAD
jgi:putative NADH-flavin reductase